MLPHRNNRQAECGRYRTVVGSDRKCDAGYDMHGSKVSLAVADVVEPERVGLAVEVFGELLPAVT